jgi:hypothetical protein
VNAKIIKRLDLTNTSLTIAASVPDSAPSEPLKADEKIVTSETELEVLTFVKKRLAYLVKDETLFSAIEKIGYKDYQGKFVVFYKRERRGWLFDFVEGGARGPKYRFSFADTPDPVTTDVLAGSVIDEPLLQAFKNRVAGATAPQETAQ